MPIPMAVARANRAALNHVMRRVAPHTPFLGLLTHRGRRSGREFTIPVNVFQVTSEGAPGIRLALTYGPGTDWVKNVLAAGGCSLRFRGRRLELADPRLVHDPARTGMPRPVRFVLARLGVEEFLDLTVVR
ncbi:nitroreductase family deazaflavin-dependent oxidoreductase [Kineococcus rhizosphaerae]|uniref:Deazaflavin-dependent oxidoreductase (Nitroreductase family) n=1 Tax=Kineococcus rhizosphaerae TaxID=559628 RepID=A0A2T0R6B3_9ACTN|nr:nitroreductase family deazaflavin-dependent oxidoreductase [Kineococcus rhizosphaerae]PRY16692.1 deazaflavin-dependent oxidoreductase (nitroreductase family) [Kineococcus rhizosphaerae]